MQMRFDYEVRIENLKHKKMIDPLGQAWQNGSALAARKPGHTTVNTYRLCGPLLHSRKCGQIPASEKVW